MNRQGIIEFGVILRLGPPAREQSRGWQNYHCPFAKWRHAGGTDRRAAFGIKVVDDGHSGYYCHACHSRGLFPTLAYELGRLRGEDYRAIGRQIEHAEILGPRITLPKWDELADPEPIGVTDAHEEVWPEPFAEFNYFSAAGHPYLRERKISVATTIKLRLRWDRSQRRILFPVYSDRGRFAGFSGRRVDPPASFGADDEPLEPSGKPYIKVRDYCGLRKREFFLGEQNALSEYSGNGLRHKTQGGCILCEGLFDYAWFAELGYSNTRAVLGSDLGHTKTAKVKRWNKPLILFFDNDQGGRDGIERIVEQLYGHIPLLSVQYPEGYEGADPHSLPADVIHKMIRNAELITKKRLTKKLIQA